MSLRPLTGAAHDSGSESAPTGYTRPRSGSSREMAARPAPPPHTDKNSRGRETGGDISRIQALEGTPVPDERATGSTQLALER